MHSFCLVVLDLYIVLVSEHMSFLKITSTNNAAIVWDQDFMTISSLCCFFYAQMMY